MKEVLDGMHVVQESYIKGSFSSDEEMTSEKNQQEDKNEESDVMSESELTHRRLPNEYRIWMKEHNEEDDNQLSDELYQLKSLVDVDIKSIGNRVCINFVNSLIEFAKEVVITCYENEKNRMIRLLQEDSYLISDQYRSRGLRRMNTDEDNVIKALIYSRKRRSKKPDYFIQSDYYSFNLF